MSAVVDLLLGHDLVERHFEGRTGRLGERRLFRHLSACADCRTRYRARAMLESLEADGGARAEARLARALFPATTPARVIGFSGLLVAGVAALLLAPRFVARDHGFTERGGAGEVAAQPGFRITRIAAGGPERAGAVVHAGEALGFSYTNPPGSGFDHLMIFARDAAGRVFWYWPAWTDAAATPRSIAITTAAAPIELREGVRHPLAPGPLRMQALFSKRPFDVRAVEAALASGGLHLLPDAGESKVIEERVEVLP